MTRFLLLAAGAVALWPWPVWSHDLAPAGQCRVQLPYVAPAQSGFDHTLVRVLNDAAHEVTVWVTGYDDTGRRFGPKPLSVAPYRVVTLTSATLEEGGVWGGLAGAPGFDGLGDGTGWWRLLLSAGQPFRAGMYYRTADQFIAELTAPVIATQDTAGRHRSDVEFFNPGSNTATVSLLRLANTADSAAEVTIAGRDDSGRAAPGGTVRLRLPAGAATTLPAAELEGGSSRLTGRLGDGEGKWRLTVTADRPLLVMSLLHATQTGHLANLSTAAHTGLTRHPPPSPGAAPDLVVTVVPGFADPPGLKSGDLFPLVARVDNSGGAASAATTLRWYLSADDTIETTDEAVGIDAIARLEAGEPKIAELYRTAPFTAGTYRYGACVDPVCGESDTTNNCSSAVPVTVPVGPDLVIGYAEVEVDRGTNRVTWAAVVGNVGDVESLLATVRIIAGGKTWDTDGGRLVRVTPEVYPEAIEAGCFDGRYAPFRLPARGGTGQICVDPVRGERNTANNCIGYTVQEAPGGEGVVCNDQGLSGIMNSSFGIRRP